MQYTWLMNTLALPTRPDNLHGGYGTPIDSDVYNICERLAEIDPRLKIHLIEPPICVGAKVYNFGITEACDDGVERLVFRTDALDARVISHVQYLLKVPFATRFAKAEAIEARREEERQEAEHAKLYETMGGPMLRQLEHDGFIEHRGVSYPKRGVKPK